MVGAACVCLRFAKCKTTERGKPTMTSAGNGLKLVFCGTPEFAVPTLEALLKAHHQIALVVSQPDRPSGREQQLTAPAVKQAALAAGLPVTQPEKIRTNAEFRAQLESVD